MYSAPPQGKFVATSDRTAKFSLPDSNVFFLGNFLSKSFSSRAISYQITQLKISLGWLNSFLIPSLHMSLPRHVPQPWRNINVTGLWEQHRTEAIHARDRNTCKRVNEWRKIQKTSQRVTCLTGWLTETETEYLASPHYRFRAEKVSETTWRRQTMMPSPPFLPATPISFILWHILARNTRR